VEVRRALKWILVIAAICVLLGVVAALTFPYWFGTALRPAASHFGVSFSNYEKLKDGRFALSNVVRTNVLFDLRISRVEGFLPQVWYRRARERRTNEAAAFLEVNGWQVVVHPRTKTERTHGRTNAPSAYSDWKETEHYIELARQWMPKATLLNGSVEYKGQNYTFPLITWDQGKLDAGGVWPISQVPFEIKGRFNDEAPYQISCMMTPLDLWARLQARETNNLLNIKVTASYKDNRADVNSFFGPTGILPLSATLKAPSLKITADTLKLKGYEDLSGSLSGEWKTNNYTLSFKAHAEPESGSSKRLPVDISLAAHGDTNSIYIEKALSTAPGLELSISQPMEFSYAGKLLSDRVELHLDADLSRIPGLKLKGTLKGTILLEKGSKFPVATVHAEASGLSGYKVAVERIQIDGRFDWPRVENFALSATVQSNTVLSAKGGGNVRDRVLDPTTIHAEGTLEAVTNVLPHNIQFSSIQLNAKVSGPVSNLVHSGQCELRDLIVPQINPTHLDVSWKGQGIAFDQLAFRARAGPATLWVSGSGDKSAAQTNFVLRELQLSKGDEAYLVLDKPAKITWGMDAQTGRPRLEIAQVSLSGTNKELSVFGSLEWPRSGDIRASARNINPDLFQAFVSRSLRGVELPTLEIAAAWNDGPLYGRVLGNFSIAEETFKRVAADLDASLDESGLTLARLSLRDPREEIVEARGFLPVSIRPLEKKKFHLSKRDKIDFEARTATNAPLWELIAARTKLRLTNAALQVAVHGTVRRPTGELHIAADSVHYDLTNRELPQIGPVDMRVSLNEQVLKLRELSLRVAGQAASVSGEMALGENFWTQPREQLLKYTLAHAEARVKAPDVELAPFTTYLPKYLSPEGRLAIDAGMKAGGDLDGSITMRGVETRPIAKVGVVQDIRANVELRGKEVDIRDFSGVLGGERVSLAGKVDVSRESFAKGYPDLDLRITGKNVPLARNPDVILRSDLDLHVRNGTNQIPLITGDATLRDSFLLRDISTLVPGRVASPKRRPPYFSLEQAPVNDWRLRVRVRGDNFMRVRSPFFQGVVSANFVVSGTMQEPVALGDATINSGTVIFPFATFDVRQAIVSMTSEDPFLPHVFVMANGRAFGFDIRMEAEGAANQPVIQFSSVPALSSEQIVLMITTGQVPRDDYSVSTQDRASKLAFFLGKSLWSKLHPGQPGEEKLTIKSGQDVTEQGRQTYEVEYKLNDRWSLVGEYDRFGALNANVKWKLFSR
jgi:translocation and assembly module TamB